MHHDFVLFPLRPWYSSLVGTSIQIGEGNEGGLVLLYFESEALFSRIEYDTIAYMMKDGFALHENDEIRRCH